MIIEQLIQEVKDLNKESEGLKKTLREVSVSTLDKGLLGLGSSLESVVSSFSQTIKGSVLLDQAFIENSQSTENFVKKLVGITAAGAGIVSTFFAVVDAGQTLASIKAIADLAGNSIEQLARVSETLTFSQAITGSDQLARNFAILDSTASRLDTVLERSLEAALNPRAFQEWSTVATQAFSDVETAAFRTSTVIVGSGERSIDNINNQIQSMRKLQEATNSSLDSVTLLNAQYEIASAGFTDPTANLQVGTASINLAQAGFGDLNGSTNAIVRALSAFGDEAEMADTRAAQLFETTKIGLLTLDQFTPQVGQLSSLAKQTGISFEEMAGSIATLTTQGVGVAEASTRFQSFVSEILEGAPKAAEALAGLSDASGKPIQLNASSLREKGIQGVLEDIKTATGGSISRVQELFSRQESAQFASLLIGAGTDTLGTATERIGNADPTNLAKEAEGRGQTLEGAFTVANNKTQAQLEELGQSLRDYVIGNLLKTNEVIDKLSTGSASFLGEFVAKAAAVGESVRAIGGFVVGAFSIAAPIVFFNLLFQQFGKLSAKITELQKPGESVIQTLRRLATDFIDDLKAKLINLIKEVKDGVNGIQRELNNLDAVDVRAEPVQRNRVFVSEEKPNRLANIIGAENASNAMGLIGRSSNIASKGLGVLGGFIKEVGFALGGLGVAATVAIGGFQILSGWFDALVTGADSRLNPAIQETASALKELNEVESISNLVDSLDTTAAKFEQTSFYAAVLDDLLTNISGTWNIITGKTFKLDGALQEFERIDSVLKNSAEQELAARQQGSFVADTGQEKLTQKRIQLGLVLDAEDINVIEKETEELVSTLNQRVEIQRKRIEEVRNSGGADRDERVAQEQAVLEQLEITVKEQIKSANVDKERLLAASKLKELQSIDTSIPINIQVNSQISRQVETQIDSFRKSINEVFSDPEVDSEKFNQLSSEVSRSIGAIQLQMSIDPEQAANSFKELQNIEGFDKVLFSDINIRKTITEFVAQLTEARVKVAQNVQQANSAVLESAVSMGSTSTAVIMAKVENEISGITAQSKALTEELNNPVTPLQRQLELVAEIEKLEAQRSTISLEGNIAAATNEKKKQLALNEQILSVEQAIANSFDALAQKGMFTVTAATARLDASQKELEVARQRLAIELEEEQIKKDSVTQSLQSKRERIASTSFAQSAQDPKATEPRLNPTNIKLPDVEIPEGANGDVIANATENTNRIIAGIFAAADGQIKAIEQTTKEQIDVTKPNFDKAEQDKIISAFQSSSETRKSFFGTENISTDTETLRRSIFKESGEATNVKALQQALGQGSAADNRTLLQKSFDFLINDLGISDNNAGRTRSGEEQRSALNSVLDNVLEAEQTKRELGTESQEQISSTRFSAESRARSTKDNEEAIKEAEANSQKQLENLDKVIADSIKDGKFTEVLSDVRARFELLDKTLAQVPLVIEKEFAERTKAIQQSEKLGQAFSNLSSAASSVFQSSALGSQLGAIGSLVSNRQESVSSEFDRFVATQEKQLTTLRTEATSADRILQTAIKSGANTEQVTQLREIRDSLINRVEQAETESQADIGSERTRTQLELLTVSLQEFEAQVTAVVDQMTKQADIIKQSIDIQLDNTRRLAQSNSAERGLTQSIFGLVGNNPFSDMLNQRLEFQNAGDQANVRQAEIVAEGQKELLDLTVLDAQLALEEQGYENALTQTQLLSDILTVSQGGEARFTRDTEQFTRGIPNLIEQSARVSAERRGLVQTQIENLPSRVNQDLRNARLEGLTNQANSLGGDLLLNPDLAQQVLRQYGEVAPSFQDRRINPGNFMSPEFQQQLSRVQRANQTIENSNINNVSSSQQKAVANQGTVVNASIPINITMESSNRSNQSQLQMINELKQYVGQTVTAGMQDLSRQVLNASR